MTLETLQHSLKSVVQNQNLIDYKKVYTILSYFADAEIKLDTDDSNNPELEVTGMPTNKKELIAKIQNFLINEQNLKKVFQNFAKIFGNEEAWQVDTNFLKPYRFLNNYIKL